MQPNSPLAEPAPRIDRYHAGLGDAISRYRTLLSSFMRPGLVDLCRLRIYRGRERRDRFSARPVEKSGDMVLSVMSQRIKGM